MRITINSLVKTLYSNYLITNKRVHNINYTLITKYIYFENVYYIYVHIVLYLYHI